MTGKKRQKRKKGGEKGKIGKHKTDQTRAKTKPENQKEFPGPHPPILRVKSGKRSPGPGASERRRLFAALRLQNRTENFGYIASVFIADEKNCRLLA
jgi:hypothetical protein